MGNKKSGNPVDTAAKIAPLDNKAYEKALRKLHVELVKLQRWVVHKGLKVCIVFEGRDGAGKGGTIKAITERVSPRIFRVVALPSPTEREKSQLYFQRYIKHLPAAGEIVIFDRSWYNRAGVERVMGFLYAGGGAEVPRRRADGGARHGRIGHYSAQVLAGGLSAGAGAPSAGSHRRRA
ncbi:polyphosphate kinase [Klebsiella pneumoniae]|uniref:Polyphosphate kinase n=1 Tax=Klebsiella pneumoniae TaxID=573 RepID=A0A3S4GEH0_KLEPN|nr:polyphosphate kinase [Klebsiella pneumoniae]